MSLQPPLAFFIMAQYLKSKTLNACNNAPKMERLSIATQHKWGFSMITSKQILDNISLSQDEVFQNWSVKERLYNHLDNLLEEVDANALYEFISELRSCLDE